MHPGHGDTLSQEPAQRTGTLTKGSASLERVRVWTLKDTAALSPALQGKQTSSLDAERPQAGSQERKPATGDPPDVSCPMIFTTASPASLAHGPPTEFISLVEWSCCCPLTTPHVLLTPHAGASSSTSSPPYYAQSPPPGSNLSNYLWPQPPTFELSFFIHRVE